MKMPSVEALAQWGRTHWTKLRTVLTTLFLIVVVFLIGTAAWRVEWAEVLEAMAQVPVHALALAGLLTLASYLVYAAFDLIGKCYVGHGLSSLRTYLSGLIVYAFIMSLGSSLGGLGLRLRLYTQQGVSPGKATRVFGLAVATNWTGYCLLAGIVFTLGSVTLPADWRLGTGVLRIAGVLMMVTAAAYLLSCFFARRRAWALRGQQIELPMGWMALAQLILAGCNWALMGSVLWVLLQQRAPYPMVLGAVMLSAIAGLVARVPAGLGVLEAILIAVLASADLPNNEVLAGALVYRAVYYLGPLFVAGMVYMLIELKPRGATSSTDRASTRARNLL